MLGLDGRREGVAGCVKTEHQKTNNAGKISSSAPIFVLHPSGTHYIPMIIDSALVAHAFESRFSQKELESNQQQQQQQQQDDPNSLLCHPITIPVNFRRYDNTYTNMYNVYETQNINVIQCRHETSVEPK